MTDNAYLKALIADSRDLGQRSTASRQEWTEEDVRQVVSGNPEIGRLTRAGYIATMYATAKPSEASDIDRLANIANQENS